MSKIPPKDAETRSDDADRPPKDFNRIWEDDCRQATSLGEVLDGMTNVDASPDAVLARALAKDERALARVRRALERGEAISDDERRWARVVHQACVGLLDGAKDVDLAALLLDLSLIHNRRMKASRERADDDAAMRGMAVEREFWPCARADAAEYMQRKTKPRLFVQDTEVEGRASLMRSEMVALDPRFADVDFASVLTERPDERPRGDPPIAENVAVKLQAIGIEVNAYQLKHRRFEKK